MVYSPQLNSTEDWEATVTKALADYRSGRSLMDQLGADRLLDTPTAGMLLAIRRSLIEETSATSAAEMVLIDMAVIAYANAMRFQSMIGNTALIIEAEMFGQPSLRAKWKKKYGARPEDISGLAAEEHVARLRDKLLPLVEKSHRIVGTWGEHQHACSHFSHLFPLSEDHSPLNRASSLRAACHGFRFEAGVDKR